MFSNTKEKKFEKFDVLWNVASQYDTPTPVTWFGFLF
jgi:hypothetical protein